MSVSGRSLLVTPPSTALIRNDCGAFSFHVATSPCLLGGQPLGWRGLRGSKSKDRSSTGKSYADFICPIHEALRCATVTETTSSQGMVAAGVRGSASEKPPIFVLKKPERKPTVQEKTSEYKALYDEFGDLTVPENHKSGYVALIGKPNVGKSTLLNQIIGQKVSIVTDKPQTTRHRILGISSSEEYQIILYDTPGFIPKTMRRIDEMMMQNVRTAAINANCVLVVVDACHQPEKMVEVLEEGKAAAHGKRPTLLVLNKIDLIKPGEIVKKTEWYRSFGGVDDIIPTSAKQGRGVELVKKWLVDRLPLGPAYYPKDIVSEHPERFFVSEIIREKIFLQYRQEIPYVSQVNVLNYAERKGSAKDFIEAEIVVERDSQMAILIGKDGSSLKLLATASRMDIQEFVGKDVYLELKVKVRENWREDDQLLDYYGYNGQIRVH